MRKPERSQLEFAFGDELIVDLFAGGGGASEGIKQAFVRDPDIAVNHDAEAVAMHTINHPGCAHLISDVFEVDPVAATRGRQVGLLWASPDCKHFSKAKGGKPRSKKIRGLAWVVVKWASLVRRAAQERMLGRSCINGTFLDELAPGHGRYKAEPDIACEGVCVDVMREVAACDT